MQPGAGWPPASIRPGNRRTTKPSIICEERLGLLDKIADESLRRELEIALQGGLIGSITITRGATSLELSACCERGLELCRRSGRTPMAFPFIFGKFTFANCRGQIDEARSLANLFLSLSEEDGYEPGRVIGHRLRGMLLLGQGEAAAAQAELELSIDLYSPERDAANTDRFGQNTLVHSRSLLALAFFCRGDVQRALQLGRETLQVADALRHPHSTALSLSYIGCNIFGLCESADHLMRHASRLIALAEQHKLGGGFHEHGVAYLGWGLIQQGELSKGITRIEEAIEGLDAIEYRLGVAGHLAHLAEGELLVGRPSKAKASLVRALEMTKASGMGWLEPDLRRIEALIAFRLQPDDPERVGDMLRLAARRAREMGTPVFERRCLMSLQEIGAGREESDDTMMRLRETGHLAELRGLVESIVGSADALG